MQALFFFIWYCATRVSPCSVSTCLSIVAFCTFSSFTFLFFIPLVFLSHCRNRIHTRKKKKKKEPSIIYTAHEKRWTCQRSITQTEREKKKRSGSRSLGYTIVAEYCFLVTFAKRRGSWRDTVLFLLLVKLLSLSLSSFFFSPRFHRPVILNR